MPALYRTDPKHTRIAPAPSSSETTEPDLEPSLYLTDEVFLFRFVGSTTCGTDEMVELEDCFTLRTTVVPVADLRERRLRVVLPE